MEANSIFFLRVILGYLKAILGTIITFYNFNITSPYNEIIKILGICIIMTSGIKIKFFQDFKPVTKP